MSNDFVGGMVYGIVIAFILASLVDIGSCSSTYTYDFPKEKKTCVFRSGVIGTCYPKEQTQ